MYLESGILACLNSILQHTGDLIPFLAITMVLRTITNILFQGGIDFRNNTIPVTSENGSCSTFLFTEAIERVMLVMIVRKDLSLFMVLNYQAVHESSVMKE